MFENNNKYNDRDYKNEGKHEKAMDWDQVYGKKKLNIIQDEEENKDE